MDKISAKSNNINKKRIRIVIAAILIAAALFAGYKIVSGVRGGSKADSVMSSLENMIPGLGVDTGTSTGIGRDPLAAVSIDGIDIVGVIEIPSLDVMAPVTGKDASEEYFATWLDGSPVQGNFMILGGRDDVFRGISSLKPGERVIFTDIDGVRYTYSVTTQYHLKKWDEGDNELQLCCESDSNTYFVVGCGIAE